MARRSRKLHYRFADSEPLELRVLLSSDGFDFEEVDDDRDEDSDDERFENDFDDDVDDDSDDERFEDGFDDDDSPSSEQIAAFSDIDTAFTSLATETNDFGIGGDSDSDVSDDASESSGSGLEVEAPVESEQQHDLDDQSPASTEATEPDTTEVDGTEAIAEPESAAEFSDTSPDLAEISAAGISDSQAVTENDSVTTSSDGGTDPATAYAHEDDGPWPGASDSFVEGANEIATSGEPGNVTIAADSAKPAVSEAVAETSVEGVVLIARSIELAALPLLSAVIPNIHNEYSSTAVFGVSSLPLLVAQTSFAAAPIALEFAPITVSASATTKLSIPIAMAFFITWLGVKEHRRLRRRTVLSVR